MAFPTTGILDDFTRANNVDLGTNWSTPVISGDGNVEIASNQAGYNTGDSSFRDEYWNPATFGADCEAYYTVATKAGTDQAVYLFLRVASPGAAGLDAYYTEMVVRSGTDNGGIYRIDNGGFTELATYSTEFTNGDGYGFEAIGSAIKTYQRILGVWVEIDSATDATYGAAGNIGIGLQGSVPRLDDFGGGTVVVAGATSLPLSPAFRKMAGIIVR